MDKKQPMQPIEYVGDVIRFRENAVINWMYEHLGARGISMNEIVAQYQAGEFSVDDMEQLYQLIGYSVSGFGSLRIPRRETVAAADAIAAELVKKRRTASKPAQAMLAKLMITRSSYGVLAERRADIEKTNKVYKDAQDAYAALHAYIVELEQRAGESES
jgi:hypothetical protein